MTAAQNTLNCPKCGNQVPSLVSVDAGLRLQLINAEENAQQIPEQVCTKCYADLRRTGTQGSKLRAQAKAREEHRKQMWHGRVGLVKAARLQMQAKKYSDAAVSYEKYFRTLEIVFEAKPGGLTPEHFRSKANQKELTVVSSVLWDLICIYDTSPRFGNRMNKAIEKLAEFARFTPIYPAIIKKAQGFERKANNPKAIRKLLKTANEKRGFCFIATTVFPDHHGLEVQALTSLRDQVLEQSALGRQFIRFYYFVSPSIAFALATFAYPLQPIVRQTLRAIAHLSRKVFNLSR